MDDLKFSVSMCVYGGDNSKWFDTSLESVFNQSLFPTEVVLFVDGSIPQETQSVIEKSGGVNLYKHNTSNTIRCFATVQHLGKEVLAA